MKNIFDEIRIIHVSYDDSIRIEFVYSHRNLLNTLRYSNKYNETWCADDRQVFVPVNEKDFLKALTKSNIANGVIHSSHYYKGCALSMNPKTHRIPYVKDDKIEIDELIDIAYQKFNFKTEEQKK